ncbi:MAG: hypothetical protein IKX98_03535 [Clostridia bacterium]|nr:hypothetical protein [Clostridia bacterium]
MKRFFKIALLAALCISVLLISGCRAGPRVEYERREITDEAILTRFNGNDYFRNVFWIDGDNCLFAFSLVSYEEGHPPAPSAVYRWSASKNEVSLIFEGEVHGVFTPDQSSCRVTPDGFVLMLERELLFFDSDYKYLSEKTVTLEGDDCFSCVSADGSAALIKDNFRIYYTELENPSERTKVSGRYLGGIGHEPITADNKSVLVPEGNEGRTTGISVYDVETGALSRLSCLDSLPEDDLAGAGTLYLYDDTHAMLVIGGAVYTDCHDTYILVDFVNDTCEVVYRTSDMERHPLPDASGTWKLERNEEGDALVVSPFDAEPVSVALEEPHLDIGGSIWVDGGSRSFVYLYRPSGSGAILSAYKNCKLQIAN